MRTLALLVFAISLATHAAEPPKEAGMAKLPNDQAPSRKVLEDVPKVRYIKDGLYPFALALKSCVDFLGGGYSYDYILGASGACVRMSWNCMTRSEGTTRWNRRSWTARRSP